MLRPIQSCCSFLIPAGQSRSSESVEQSFGVRGDPQHPLPQRNAFDRMAAAFALAVLDFFVGQHRPQRRAPIHQRVVLVGQPVRVAILRDRIAVALRLDFVGNRQFGDRPPFLLLGIEPGVVQHQKDPLGPAKVVLVGRRHHAVPVVAETEHLQLPSEVVDVPLRLDPRMLAGLDRVFFGRQSEGVEAHRMQDTFAPHPGESGNDVGRRVALGMPDVQPVAAGIREHVQDVALLAGSASRGSQTYGARSQ